MRVLGIIPARGGSKGVPGKNIKLLGGKPLLYYTAQPALDSKMLTKVMLTTDSEDIAEVGRKLGVDVPFLRPAELAKDDTPTLPVIQHVVNFYKEQGEEFDAICLLQPTNPLRLSSDIDACVELMIRENFDSVVAMIPVPHEYNPSCVYFMDATGKMRLSTGDAEPITRRQLFPPAFAREGSIYLTKTNCIMENNSIYGKNIGGYVINTPIQLNIDTLADWEKAEEYFSRK